ncbi:Uu.00g053820.m01.CDS01 [Anthostomella pinea]|uniref:Uu.00g053820.m01.CDS01 n=1 Tax=Anthostomella pinea TaxID=933095 RepID=A0AAI8VWG4_9PEZI|nr:Uu.00g053820.m01.CDS01 [Anthostomella pinea]
MSEVGRSCGSPAARTNPSSPKRRKIRKGTQSCWECKRRKTRCSFAKSTALVCDGCRSRRTKCVSQEFDDERIDRMASLAGQSVKRNGRDAPHNLNQSRPDQEEGAEPIGAFEGSPPSVLLTMSGLEPGVQVNGGLEDISSALRAVWPNQHDLDLILSVPVGVSVLLHGVMCMPYSAFASEKLASPRHLLELPPEGSHPVHIARRLLMLGTFLQGISPSFADKLADMRSEYRNLMSRVVDTATRLVTSNDELVESLEGIECVMIESMYLNNAGNLRRAWLANRRAMVMAQMMGLGLPTGTGSLVKVLEKETYDRIDPEYMWFRIVSSDRYLSLMLGLPQGTLENVFASPKALENCMSMERMERMMSVAGRLILQRNGAERTDIQATYQIDKMLQEAAAMMPPQWWSMAPDLTEVSNNDAKAFQETVRLMNQFAYHHMLVQLHLPYILQASSTASSYDYNKMTAATASRAIVALFVSIRNSVLASAYCRGIDFVVFIASTTLCLVHIEARRQLFNGLQHQRLSDRGLLERTLEIMETMAEQNQDVIAREICGILRPLLAIEDSSAKGGYYHASASPDGENRGARGVSGAGDAHDVLRIEIPYFGTIRIEHRPSLGSPIQVPSDERIQSTSTSQATENSLIFLRERASSPNQEQHHLRQGGPASDLQPAGYEISTTEPANTDWQSVPSHVSANLDPDLLSSDTGGDYEQLLVPGLEAGIHDWALQGVDMALFSSLTQGSVDPTETTLLSDM